MVLEASSRSNYNEQYSRKNNIKIHGVEENEHESATDAAKRILSTVAKVQLKDSEIVALHRVSGKKGRPRPILVKVQDTEVKARIMRQRPVVKKADKGYRLADDVTRLNSDLSNA